MYRHSVKSGEVTSHTLLALDAIYPPSLRLTIQPLGSSLATRPHAQQLKTLNHPTSLTSLLCLLKILIILHE